MSIIKRVSAIQGCPFRGVPLYIKVMHEDVTCATHLVGNALEIWQFLKS